MAAKAFVIITILQISLGMDSNAPRRPRTVNHTLDAGRRMWESNLFAIGYGCDRENTMRMARGKWVNLFLLAGLLTGVRPGLGQVLGGTGAVPEIQGDTPNPLADTTMKPGKALLFDLEAKFAKATAEGGGNAFASWFAEDGVSMGNGKTPAHGRDAIAKEATWSPKNYQLQWTPTDGVMSPGGYGLHLGPL
jgi:hypothetical protein